jgi:DNA processing protein
VIALGPVDARYPRGLLDLRGPPDPLWCDGDPAALSQVMVSIVGTRRMTPYGARVARELSGACALAGIVVVSGLAQGIDSAAHEGALDRGGKTVAVLGAGIAAYVDGLRGRRRRLAHTIRAQGVLVSEFPPDAPARRWTFAQRNATIAALGAITVVVEAPAVSGALITAEDARRAGRPVCAVPGAIGASASAGTNALIESGRARLLTGPAMLLSMLGSASPATARPESGLDTRILDALAASPADPDMLARRLGVRPDELTALLARMMLSGDVGMAPDGRLARR